MVNLKLDTQKQFYIDKFNKIKLISYKDLRYDKKHNNYEFYNRYDKLKIGIQLCDFVNIKVQNIETIKEFINKYGISCFVSLSNTTLYRDYEKDAYDETINTLLKEVQPKLEPIIKAFIEDITYIYNLNELEELNNLTPAERLFILRNSKKGSEVLKLYNPNDLKLSLNSLGVFNKVPITSESYAQEIAQSAHLENLCAYCFECEDLIQTFIIELFDMTEIDNIVIKKCKNCGKFFVPDNRIDELYCSNIFEDNKTCKDVGPFRTKQKLMQEDDSLRIYRNIYQKLLLRTRRNPDSLQYEKDFENFKKENAKLKKDIESGKFSQDEYVNWLQKQ